ncbi:DUF2971 domain-containing protein [Chloroflexota bacterium]
MTPEKVYHYTTKETALEKILTTQKIRFNFLGQTNDPRESKEWGYPILNPPFSLNETSQEETIRWLDEYSKIESEAKRIRNKEWQILCFSQDDPRLKTQKGDISLYHLYGYSRSRMWSQYAGNHTGICFIFDREKLNDRIHEEIIQEDLRFFQGSVEYSDMKSSTSLIVNYEDIKKHGITEGIRKFFYNDYKAAFLTKSKEWESEYEYRWLIHSQDEQLQHISVEGIISGLLVGVDFPEVYEPSLIAICKKLNILGGKMDWRQGIPIAQFNSIYNPDNK